MPTRRGFLALGGLALAGCAHAPVAAWEQRLRGDTLALLGEVHDNPEAHRLRAAVLQRACDAGWRPALVMEQFDIDRQADIDRSRRERPGDARHLVAQAAGVRSGWNWALYEPVIALALRHELPLRAGNLPRAQAARLVREGFDAVFDAARVTSLGLDVPADAAWQAAQEREIDAGHCGALPANLWPGMARAQFARDAVMAQLMREHGRDGAVLLAGNGHVRRDIGVPRWLGDVSTRVLSVGFVETTEDGTFDDVVVTPRAPRGDPCATFRP